MPRTLNFIHTAAVHSETFDALGQQIAPGQALRHDIRVDWLTRAQGGIDDALAAEIANTVAAAQDPVICTCTTIGEVAEAAGAIRIDRPMMQAAARISGPVLMVYCLTSTLEPSRALLQSELDRAGNLSEIRLLPLAHLWPLFEAGKTGEFADEIANAVSDAVQKQPDLGCAVLAQASMAAAAALLADLPLTVLASPEQVLRAGLARL